MPEENKSKEVGLKRDPDRFNKIADEKTASEFFESLKQGLDEKLASRKVEILAELYNEVVGILGLIKSAKSDEERTGQLANFFSVITDIEQVENYIDEGIAKGNLDQVIEELEMVEEEDVEELPKVAGADKTDPKIIEEHERMIEKKIGKFASFNETTGVLTFSNKEKTSVDLIVPGLKTVLFYEPTNKKTPVEKFTFSYQTAKGTVFAWVETDYQKGGGFRQKQGIRKEKGKEEGSGVEKLVQVLQEFKEKILKVMKDEARKALAKKADNLISKKAAKPIPKKEKPVEVAKKVGKPEKKKQPVKKEKPVEVEEEQLEVDVEAVRAEFFIYMFVKKYLRVNPGATLADVRPVLSDKLLEEGLLVKAGAVDAKAVEEILIRRFGLEEGKEIPKDLPYSQEDLQEEVAKELEQGVAKEVVEQMKAEFLIKFKNKSLQIPIPAVKRMAGDEEFGYKEKQEEAAVFANELHSELLKLKILAASDQQKVLQEFVDYLLEQGEIYTADKIRKVSGTVRTWEGEEASSSISLGGDFVEKGKKILRGLGETSDPTEKGMSDFEWADNGMMPVDEEYYVAVVPEAEATEGEKRINDVLKRRGLGGLAVDEDNISIEQIEALEGNLGKILELCHNLSQSTKRPLSEIDVYITPGKASYVDSEDSLEVHLPPDVQEIQKISSLK